MATQLRRLSVAELLGCLIDFISEQTGISCYDDPDNKASPLYSVQLIKSEPANTKTEFRDVFQVWIHCIGEPVKPYSTAPVLSLVQTLEEAMTNDLPLPAPYALQRQVYGGIQTLKKDESGEGHAVLAFDFHVRYGFRCK